MKNLDLILNSFKYIKSRLKGNKLILMLIALFIMLTISILTTYIPVLLGEIVDNVIVNKMTSFENIKYFLVLIAILLFSAEILTWIRKFIVEKIATSIEKDEFIKITKHILSVDLTTLNGERIGALNVKIHRSIQGVIKLLKLTFIDFLPLLLTSIVAIYILITKSFIIACITFIIIIISIFITLKQITSQKGIRIELFRAKEDIGAKNSELLMGIDYVKASGAIQYEVGKIETLAEFLRKKEFLHHKFMMSFDSLKMFIEIIGFLLTITISAYFAIQGTITKGDVLTFAMLYNSITVPLRNLNRFLDEGFEAILMINDLLSIYSKEIDIGLKGNKKPSLVENIIDCNKISYNIGKKYILKDIDLKIKKGEKIGIAGASGSGKSTLIKILLGLNSHYKGEVKVFSEEVRKIDKLALSKLISYIPQNPFIIKGSIRENILYPHFLDISDDDIYKAMNFARIDNLINSSNGINRTIEEQGKNLSGGEKQRLALARLFLSNNSELIIMDEATSALDSINQDFIQNQICLMNKQKTIITIAHRLKTLKNMDRIIVFDNASIVEEGSYQELIKKDGYFKALLDKEK